MSAGHKAFSASLLAFAAMTLVANTASGQTTLRLISGWASNNPNVPLIEAVFIKNVEASSKGEIKIQRSGPEVVPPFDQLQPVSAGVFDILFTTPGYHQAQSGVAGLFDAFKGDPVQWRETGLFAWADNYYVKRFGVRILTLHPAPGNHFVLREALGTDGTLKGRKVRSNPIFDGIIRALGGTPVSMSPADAYSAMQKGVIDGIAIPAFASADYKLYEVGKYMTRPTFGQTNILFAINARKFEALPEHLRKILVDEGRKIEAIGAKALSDYDRGAGETMTKNGVAISNFDANTAASLPHLFNEGIYATASKSSPNEVRALWELAKSKNMLNE